MLLLCKNRGVRRVVFLQQNFVCGCNFINGYTPQVVLVDFI